MPLPTTSHRLFERTWRSSCPIRPRHSRLRRWAGLLLLALLCTLIVGYAFITDSDRVRQQAETYLSRLVGGPVAVESASLSLFEGFRLEGVTVRTPVAPGEEEPPDSLIFTARSVRIDYNPLDLLLGRLSATRVVAVDPHVRLVEDTQTHEWNFQRLRRHMHEEEEEEEWIEDLQDASGSFTSRDELPEILLRNVQVEYGRREAGKLVPRGTVGIEAQLTPAAKLGGEKGAYRFGIQTRGLSPAPGEPSPRASGTINRRAGRLEARLEDVYFDALPDILPRAASEWLRRHGIAGRLDVPKIEINFDNLVRLRGPDGREEMVPQFRVIVRLNQAQMQGLPEQWLSTQEVQARLATVQMLTAMRGRTSDPRALDVLDRLIDQATLRPVRLTDVDGTFIFNERGLHIAGLEGQFEGNRLRVDGIINGYHRDAGLSLVVQNADEALVLPPDVPYISSLPREVREIYARFLPMGRCGLRMELHRPEAGAGDRGGRPIVTGYVDVLDGTFTLDQFPYPIRHARGRLLLRYERRKQEDQLLIEDLRGYGMAGGPNEEAMITVNGLVAPLNDVAGFDIRVIGRNVSNEQALVEALPEEAREVVASFDPAHHGRGIGIDGGAPPVMGFGGDFTARVTRPPGPRQQWDFRVDLALRNMSGAFEEFPYPLTDASADVSVFSDRVQITRARMMRPGAGDRTASVDFHGTVAWGRRPGDAEELAQRGVRVDLTIIGENVPADPALLAALPEEAADRLRSLGVGGSADVTARIFTGAGNELSWDVALDLRGGRFWPETGTFSLSDAQGRVRVLPQKLILTDVRATRGEGTVAINATIDLDEAQGQMTATVAARNVMLDAALYELLPSAGKAAWDWVRPTGAMDADVTYRGPTALLGGGDVPEGAEPTYDILLRPQGISVLPEGFAYPMEEVYGEIHLSPGRIDLLELTASRSLEGEAPTAELVLTGQGLFGAGEDGGDVWELQPRFENVPIDEALLAALPAGLSETLTSLKAAGTLSAEFTELTIRPREAEEAEQPEASEGGMLADVVFDVKIQTSGLSTDVGVPLSNVEGTLELSGTYDAGTLHELSGSFDAARYAVSGRGGTGLRGNISLPAGSRTLSISNIIAQLAGGQMVGSVQLVFGEDEQEATRYSAAMTVREVDVRKLVGEQPGRAGDVEGHLTARLDIEGRFGDAASRRGRGEVVVSGQRLYDLPLVLGLLQVTNLTMPLNEPFREATASFTVNGPQVIFDRISLRASEMAMTGDGTLNFETQKVDLSFTTSNHGWAQIPLVGDLVGLARNELLRIHVRGTLQSPEVGGSTLPTVTSTIDEVFRRR